MSRPGLAPYSSFRNGKRRARKGVLPQQVAFKLIQWLCIDDWNKHSCGLGLVCLLKHVFSQTSWPGEPWCWNCSESSCWRSGFLFLVCSAGLQGWDCFKGVNFLLASPTRNRRCSTLGLQQHKDHLIQKLSPAEPYMLLQIVLEPSPRFCS